MREKIMEGLRLDFEQLKNLQSITPLTDRERVFIRIEIKATQESIKNLKELLKRC